MIFRLVKRLASTRLYSDRPHRLIRAFSSANRSGSGGKETDKNAQACLDPSHSHEKMDETGAPLRPSHSFQHIYDSISKHSDPSSRLLLGYTCRSCRERSYHSISKTAYSTGIVIATCPGCSNRHLIADHLGWFKNLLQDSTKHLTTIDKLLEERGETITTNYTIERSQGEMAAPLKANTHQQDMHLSDLDDISIIPKKTSR